jgi:hypothetical protein
MYHGDMMGISWDIILGVFFCRLSIKHGDLAIDEDINGIWMT